jgi:NAD(P)-dependent dehydrogenase (short-subunit alcohol dehydrogenase family)
MPIAETRSQGLGVRVITIRPGSFKTEMVDSIETIQTISR